MRCGESFRRKRICDLAERRLHAANPELMEKADWLRPVVSPDPSDPKLAHLDGLNLSRAAGCWKASCRRCPRTIRAVRRSRPLRRPIDARDLPRSPASIGPGRPLARQFCGLPDDSAWHSEMSGGRFPRRLRGYYNSAVRVCSSARGAPPEGFQARRCQKSARSFRLPRKMLSSAFLMLAMPMG